MNLCIQNPQVNFCFHVVPGYEEVADVLQQALNQAQIGKGKERHAHDEPFTEQEIMEGARKCGMGAMIYQVRKKSLESKRLTKMGEYEKALADLNGAIVYAAAAILRLREIQADDEDSVLI